MSDKPISLDVIKVASPCTADWNAMTGDEARRLCTHCNKHVHNLSAMSRRKASRLVAESQGGLCVRFSRDHRGRVATRTCATWLSRAAALLLGIFTLACDRPRVMGDMCEPHPPAGESAEPQGGLQPVAGAIQYQPEIMGDIAIAPDNPPPPHPPITGELQAIE